MTYYSVIYILIIIAMIVFIIRHKIDLLSVATVCYIVYTIYCIPGIGISGFYATKLSPKLYWSVYAQCIIVLLFSILVRRKERNSLNSKKSFAVKAEESSTLIRSFYIYTYIIVAFAAVNVLRIGFAGFAAGKANVWEESNIFYILSLYGAYPSFAFGLHNRKKGIWIPSLLVELTIFFAGSRAFATTLVIILLCERGRELWEKRKQNFKIYMLGAIGIAFLLMYRMVDQQIMAGDIAGVLETLKQPGSWLEAFEFNEPRVIIANYDYVLTTGFRLPFGDSLYRILDFVPGLTSIIPIKLEYSDYFSAWLQDTLHAVRGVGGTIWGESYAMLGYGGILIFTLIWLTIIYRCNKHLDYHAPISYFIVALGSYYAWYINRLEFNLVGQAFKVFILCLFIWAVPYLILGGNIKVGKIRIQLLSK